MNTSLELKKGGVENRGSQYAKVVPYFNEALEKMVYLMRNSKNEGIAFGAARWIGDKILPDLQAASMEVNGQITHIYITRKEEPINGSHG